MNRIRQCQQQDPAGISTSQPDSSHPIRLKLLEIVQRAWTAEHRILRLHQVKSKIARANATIWKDVADGTLSRPISTGARSVGWLESEVNAWIEARIFNSRNPSQAIDMRELVALLAHKNGDDYRARPQVSLSTELFNIGSLRRGVE
ncbi:AlpA family transcriptional regulator [Collimonas sp. PA-H2]|uniref:helix-turn-helix transcriptional regulator n=1 Tax=Collimonas sp. PA-H2 TaxID=1881062 RepID=UPI000BF91FA6|nr:AlpA family phage regulatory protein [Collimonas sp. PA-H2]